WRHITSNIQPLKGRAKKRVPIAPRVEPPAAAAPVAEKPRLKSISIGGNAPERPAVTVTPALEPGIAAGIDRNTFQKFRSGAMAIDGTLDLHGMTQAEAHEALIRYIGTSYRLGRRCLIVVTGKGLRGGDPDAGFRPPGGRGILQQAVPKWLNALELRPMILAIAHAQPKHGGTGALYVLLRRKRE
ncbi:MAG: Smr/MutS family protein, partial [Alphaproteobacteria bacterium]